MASLSRGRSLVSERDQAMNRLPRDKQIQIITALTEGCSIRSVERMTGAHRDTIMRLLVRTGYRCMSIMDDTIKNVRTSVIECDEVWTFVGKKDYSYPLEQQTPGDGGSQFVAVAMDRDTKLIITYRVGKRFPELAYGVISDLKERVVGRPTIVTDGWGAYFEAVANVYGKYGCNFGQLVKSVTQHRRKFVREGYHVAKVVSARKYPIFGNPHASDISTSIVERQNWTLRTHMRRMTRMSNGFSRKLDNLKAAVALHYCTYNFCRIHKTTRVTPAMAAGLADHIWEINDLLAT